MFFSKKGFEVGGVNEGGKKRKSKEGDSGNTTVLCLNYVQRSDDDWHWRQTGHVRPVTWAGQTRGEASKRDDVRTSEAKPETKKTKNKSTPNISVVDHSDDAKSKKVKKVKKTALSPEEKAAKEELLRKTRAEKEEYQQMLREEKQAREMVNKQKQIQVKNEKKNDKKTKKKSKKSGEAVQVAAYPHVTNVPPVAENLTETTSPVRTEVAARDTSIQRIDQSRELNELKDEFSYDSNELDYGSNEFIEQHEDLEFINRATVENLKLQEENEAPLEFVTFKTVKPNYEEIQNDENVSVEETRVNLNKELKVKFSQEVKFSEQPEEEIYDAYKFAGYDDEEYSSNAASIFFDGDEPEPPLRSNKIHFDNDESDDSQTSA